MIRIMIDKKRGIKNTGETLCYFELKKNKTSGEYVDDNITYFNDIPQMCRLFNKYMEENARKQANIDDFHKISAKIEELCNKLIKTPKNYKIEGEDKEFVLYKKTSGDKWSPHRYMMKHKSCIDFIIRKYPMHSDKEITNVADLAAVYKELEELV